MGKRMAVLFVAVLVVAALGAAAGEKEKSKGTAYVGWVTDTHCGAKGAKEGHTGCAKKCVAGGAKYALVTPADGKIYTLDPQDKAAGHAGHHVKVTGTVEGGTLKVESIEMTGEQKGHGEKEKKDKPNN